MSVSFCNGGCGIKIGSGCGCCSPEFPEEYGYCSKCFPSSDYYALMMNPLKSIMDSLCPDQLVLLSGLFDNTCEVHSMMQDAINKRIRDRS